ncbi:protein phosphatase 2C domain-containing protein [Paenibacillus sp.]|uniref:protein phosphatase 2C domain-containing protein n=1 Tax=Paenibacillus sp. TaxID=58172 RepID=UPI002D3D4DAF|nr:protein phosphatase 2C domain-containing protein [Paenibacillus sp.]HZG84141.1 protein phosphatase 2C domain-containing protein [Paenibacillus sp.]
MIVETISIQGSGAWNEDALVSRTERGVYAVVDGATSLVPFAGAGGETGGYLAARIVAELLDEGAPAADEPLRERLIAANRRLREAMEREGIDPSRKEALWSAAAVVVRVRERSVEYAQASDCMLAALYADGSVRVVTRDQNAPIDRETLRLWAEGAAGGQRDRSEQWRGVLPQIVDGRRRTNTDAGYAVLNGDPAFDDYVEHGSINRIGLKALLLMSDGLYVCKPAGEEPFDAAETLRMVAGMGLKPFVEWLIRREESDPDGRLYPRVKTSDDKTAVWIQF